MPLSILLRRTQNIILLQRFFCRSFVLIFFIAFASVSNPSIHHMDHFYDSLMKKKTRKFQYIIVGSLDRTQLTYLISIILLLKFAIKSHFFQLRFFFACICGHMNHIYFAVIKKHTHTLLIGRHH